MRVAICGAHKNTLKDAEHSRADELWVLGAVWKFVPSQRIAKIIEIHPESMVASPVYNVLSPGHYEYLTKSLPAHVKVVTAKLWDSIPADSQEMYPFQEVHELIDVYRVGPDKRPRKNIYLSSSIDYALAMVATRPEVQEVELYGFDMGTWNQTEYMYQIPGVAHWVGVLAGRGVKVVLPEAMTHLKGSIYGWETGEQMVPRTVIKHLHDENEAKAKAALKSFESLQARSDELFNKLDGFSPKARAKAVDRFNALKASATEAMAAHALYYGAQQALEILLENYDMPEHELHNPFTATTRTRDV